MHMQPRNAIFEKNTRLSAHDYSNEITAVLWHFADERPIRSGSESRSPAAFLWVFEWTG